MFEFVKPNPHQQQTINPPFQPQFQPPSPDAVANIICEMKNVQETIDYLTGHDVLRNFDVQTQQYIFSLLSMRLRTLISVIDSSIKQLTCQI